MTYKDGEKHYHTEANADLLAAKLWGVLNGLEVTENSTPDMNVIVGIAVQLSVAVTAVMSTAGRSPMHSTVTSAGQVMTGSMVSSIVIS